MFKADADRSGEQTADLQQNLLDRGSAFARSKSAEQRLDRIEAPANVPVTPIKRPDTTSPEQAAAFFVWAATGPLGTVRAVADRADCRCRLVCHHGAP